jgi:predicted aspartyl protease
MEPKAFTVKYPGISNKLIYEVKVAAAVQSSAGGPPIGTRKYDALWDTGATNSMISQNVIDNCFLKPISIAKIKTAGGELKRPVFLVSLWFTHMVCFPSQVVPLLDPPMGLDVVIGMDVMNQGDLAVTNKNGATVFSFRQPSQTLIDFVKKIKQSKYSNVNSTTKCNNR